MIKEGRRLVVYRNEAGERVGLRTERVDEAGQRHAQGVAAGKVRPLAGDGFPGAGKASHLLTDLLRCDGCKRAMTFRGLSCKCEKERACGICPAPASAYAGALERKVVGRWLNVVMALEPTDALAVKIAERWTALTLPEETEEARGARDALVAAESSLGRLMADRQAGLYDGPAARYFAPLHRDAIDPVEAAQKHLDTVAPRAVLDTSIVDDGQLLRETWEAAELDMRRSLLHLAIDALAGRPQNAEPPGRQHGEDARRTPQHPRAVPGPGRSRRRGPLAARLRLLLRGLPVRPAGPGRPSVEMLVMGELHTPAGQRPVVNAVRRANLAVGPGLSVQGPAGTTPRGAIPRHDDGRPVRSLRRSTALRIPNLHRGDDTPPGDGRTWPP
ncbi:hypothetical protein Stsp01_21030 [Streptomyces sp. NBRC 13847]|nr:hypothetical protein Stsp01_21030 [Streptomyces sp. NBRC 13847]